MAIVKVWVFAVYRKIAVDSSVTSVTQDRIAPATIPEDIIGRVIYFLELNAAISAMLLDVNPFDQPGVENYKREIRQLVAESRSTSFSTKTRPSVWSMFRILLLLSSMEYFLFIVRALGLKTES